MRSLRHFFRADDTPGPRAPWRVFWVAFAVRVLYMTLAHTFRVRPFEDHFQFGWEAGRIARALVTGFGYADPFSNAVLAHTGPTAWLPPVYPLLIAGVFKVFGVFTPLSAWVLLALNSAFSAATAMAAWEIGARCFDRATGMWAGWIWALYPAAMQYAVRWIWEMSLTTALFAWAIVLALRMRGVGDRAAPAARASSARQWALFGLLWGLIALSNSSLLLFLPVCALWIAVGLPRTARTLGHLGLSALVVLASVAPWTWRNYRAFGAFVPLRGNLGAEMYLGNGPGSSGWLMEYDHPFQAPDQLRQYAAMGELRYAAMRGRLAQAYIHEHRAHYWGVVGKRLYFFWWSVPHPADNAWYVETGRVLNFGALSLCGLLGLALALWRRLPAAGLFAWAFLLLPIPYYLVTVHARFRHPLEPLIAVLGVYLFRSAERRRAA